MSTLSPASLFGAALSTGRTRRHTRGHFGELSLNYSFSIRELPEQYITVEPKLFENDRAD